MIDVLEDAKFVVDNSKLVSINKEKIKEFCETVDIKDFEYWFEIDTFDIKNLNEEQKLNLLFIFDSLNFSYWGFPKWSVQYKGKMLGGAFSMISCLLKAHEKGIPILNMGYLSGISRKDFERITQANVKIPLFEERLNIIRENATILKEKFDGRFSNVIKKANKDVLKLLELIMEKFPSFRDSCKFNNRKVHFLKRAQLLVFEVYEIFKGKGFGEFKNIEKITGFADYKIPNVLHLMGILEYDDKLSEKINNKIPLEKCSKEECEIRANMLWAIHLITEELQGRFPGLLQTYVNDYVWSLGRKKEYSKKPHHLVRTTSY